MNDRFVPLSIAFEAASIAYWDENLEAAKDILLKNAVKLDEVKEDTDESES